MGNKLEKQQRKLQYRQQKFDKQKKSKEGFKRPGSLNIRKQK